MCVCACRCACVRASACVCVQVCLYVELQVCRSRCMCAGVCIATGVQMYMCRCVFMHVCRYVCSCRCAEAGAGVCVHACVHVASVQGHLQRLQSCPALSLGFILLRLELGWWLTSPGVLLSLLHPHSVGVRSMRVTTLGLCFTWVLMLVQQALSPTGPSP